MNKRDAYEMRFLNETIDGLRSTLAVANGEAGDLRKEVAALKKGIVTTWEVVTYTGGAAKRTVTTFVDVVDALHFATDKRLGGAFERVVIFELESRHQALHSDGRVIQPFGVIDKLMRGYT